MRSFRGPRGRRAGDAGPVGDALTSPILASRACEVRRAPHDDRDRDHALHARMLLLDAGRIALAATGVKRRCLGIG